MTTYKGANLGAWALATKKRANAIVKQSTNDLCKLVTRTAPGTTRGGDVKPGYVPRDLGFLAASFQSSLNGTTAVVGEASYTLVVTGMEAGDFADFGWTAEYARAVHYRGWLWLDNGAVQWPRIVAENIIKAKAISR